MTPMTMALASKASEAENDKLRGRSPAIQTPGGTAFNDVPASNEVIAAYALRIGEGTGPLGVTQEDITSHSPGNMTHALDAMSREQWQSSWQQRPSE